MPSSGMMASQRWSCTSQSQEGILQLETMASSSAVTALLSSPVSVQTDVSYLLH